MLQEVFVEIQTHSVFPHPLVFLLGQAWADGGQHPGTSSVCVCWGEGLCSPWSTPSINLLYRGWKEELELGLAEMVGSPTDPWA